ncbi:MAG: hypothetical protein CMD74_00690 [Gammaproteobacteria bacterium]|nr:hypothetical protein [Gammaproteobacteria bacterium]
MITRDLIERVVATFVQAAIGAMSSNSMFDLGVDQWKMMAGAGVAAAVSVLKGALATKIGTPGTASLAD